MPHMRYLLPPAADGPPLTCVFLGNGRPAGQTSCIEHLYRASVRRPAESTCRKHGTGIRIHGFGRVLPQQNRRIRAFSQTDRQEPATGKNFLK
ncbi:hypothetical protein GCM10010236_49830 [Streptomyces eurythermus]|nr:hypothetical protein GCM10010236_49830 [Streptomyces eurythermus]